MKRLNYLVNGLAALALIVLFSQCAGKADNQAANASTQAAGVSGMKIAYVEIDTLLAKYNYCVDLNEAMVKKSENVRLTLNQKAKDLDRQKQEFQTKVQNNAYLTQERAQQEYNRIAKLEQDLQNLGNKLQAELMSEVFGFLVQSQTYIFALLHHCLIQIDTVVIFCQKRIYFNISNLHFR